MRKPLLLATIALIAAPLAACGDRPPPAEPIAFDGTVPPVEADADYASFTLERDFDVPRDVLMPWMTETTRMVDAMEETENIKKPVAIDILSGTWPEDGSVRRVTLSDGHQTLERVVRNGLPERFEYQIWNFTTSAGGNLDYALGTQVWSEVDADGDGADDETRLTWTYALLPDAGFKRRFVQDFVDNDIEPFLTGAADRVVAQAERELAER